MFDISLQRLSTNRLNPVKVRSCLRKFTKSIERKTGVSPRVSKVQEPFRVSDNGFEKYLYKIKVKLECHATKFNEVCDTIQSSCYIAKWQVVTNADLVNVVDVKGELKVQPDIFTEENIKIPVFGDDVVAEHFNGIYEREPHIRLIHDAATSFLKNNGKRRGHVLLYGEPASCKTSLFERFKSWYDGHFGREEVTFLDGPQMTKAGLEAFIMEKVSEGLMPKFLVIEEIEKKASLENLAPLLSLMTSGSFVKTNARIGRKQTFANCCIWATCNDQKRLEDLFNGAIWSRFVHKYECHRPSKELMEKIIIREVQEMNGNMEWVGKVMELAYDILKLNDPREITGLLDGGDRLMDGSYQKDVIRVYARKQA